MPCALKIRDSSFYQTLSLLVYSLSVCLFVFVCVYLKRSEKHANIKLKAISNEQRRQRGSFFTSAQQQQHAPQTIKSSFVWQNFHFVIIDNSDDSDEKISCILPIRYAIVVVAAAICVLLNLYLFSYLFIACFVIVLRRIFGSAHSHILATAKQSAFRERENKLTQIETDRDKDRQFDVYKREYNTFLYYMKYYLAISNVYHHKINKPEC